ncbi:monofunctional biosynthetic peptidoglycan transglycosylase [Corallococcus sp. M34]|uniref:monofunctional biosynthetic peptidoglycan transglycosylase n=1 Tax=Citreicoccus inhibens TaxID=2849499 RepID=UPI0018F5180A|nr:monofunctional biosynthetic peptidoglycan transglycosylase [Citreicoccus inhibens]MBU8900248.1 monofunctional biosynthetic peptidoglycan transglycosylase [Citreicoccus inhibens]
MATSPPARRSKPDSRPPSQVTTRKTRTVRRRAGTRWGRWLMLALVVGLGFGAYAYLALPEATWLATQNPKTTALIEQRAEEAREEGKKARRRQQWVPLSSIAKHAVDAVVISEDASFYLHDGVDTVELARAVEESVRKHKLGRGASTITQQLAKNLWLSTDRSLWRKGKELVLARRLEDALTKKRILTLYLNVVEWGNGVYGIEAGAREHFGVSAAQVSVAQAAILAAMLPAPRKRSPSSGSPALWRHAQRIVTQLETVRRITHAQAEEAHAEVDRLLGRAPAGAGDAEEPVEEEG